MQMLKTKKKKKSIVVRAALAVVLLVLLVQVMSIFVQQRVAIAKLEKEYQQIQKQVEEQTLENEELRSISENEDLSEYMEKIARESFDYAYPGEYVYVNVAGVD